MIVPHDGDVDLFEQFYRDWWEKVRSTARTLLGSDDEAQNAAQRVFARVWRTGAWRTIERPGDFFHRAAVNEALSIQRRQTRADKFSRQLARVDPLVPESPDAPLIRHERRAILEQMIERLPHRCGIICRLVYLHELTHSEAARALGISVGAVEKQVARARRSLRSLAGEPRDAVSPIEVGGGGGGGSHVS